MELKVSSEIENRIGINDSRGKTNKPKIILLRVVCKLDDVVSERSPATSLRRGTAVRRSTRNGYLAWNLIEILDYVKARKAGPAKDEQGRD